VGRSSTHKSVTMTMQLACLRGLVG